MITPNGTTAVTRLIKSDATDGFSGKEKCTWTMMSTTKAPTFSVRNAASITDKYDIMYQEWVDGWQGLTLGVDFEPRTSTRPFNGIIFPHLNFADKYDAVAKYNYKDVSGGNQGDALMAANDAQRSGLAYVFQYSDCKTVDGLVGSATVNNAGTVVANCW
jgi:hypothetical protein